MILDTLKNFDTRTANGVLAAAALKCAPYGTLDDAQVVITYGDEASALIQEIRQKLHLGGGTLRPDELAQVDETLGKLLSQSILSSDGSQEALARAGQAGRLPPGLYKVEQPPHFQRLFRQFKLKKRVVEEVVHQPDDFQHLLNNDAVEKDLVSLFMKRVLPPKAEPHWLLVQTHRSGLIQIAQAAWRVFPSDVDLSGAEKPLDVLKAFVHAFGLNTKVANKDAKFIESEAVYGEAAKNIEFAFDVPSHTRFFAAPSHVQTTDPRQRNVGVAYCINLDQYAESMRAHGFDIRLD